MRKHGWQLPYHPLQVVAIAVFLALGFAFYVFFVPFVGKKLFEYIVIGLYTPLVLSVFCLYIWCAAADPGDAGVFKSKKYLNSLRNTKGSSTKLSGQCRTQSPKKKPNVSNFDNKILENAVGSDIGGGESSVESERKDVSCCILKFVLALFSWIPLILLSIFSCPKEQSSEQQQSSEDGMFYCSLCEVEVYKYSKHCRVCDKCVDGFDHHCRWLNNCIGRKNYRRFFILMVSALLLLILQWSIGILVLVRCFVERKNFNGDIESKLGSSFSLVPFIVVVVTCSLLAMVATLPLAQLFFFHVLLMQKGISTYDYIIALREQEQHGIVGQQSPQMSPLSSLTGLSSASSFNTFHRAAWCTPPRLFVEDQFDVIPPEASSSKKILEEQNKKKLAGTVKINPWTLARLNAEEVSKAAAQARKKSKVLQPAVRRENSLGREAPVNIGSKSGRMSSRIDNRRRVNKRGRVPADLPLEPLAKISASATDSNGSDMAPESSSLAPLQLEARTAFRTSRAMSSAGIFISSPDSSLESPDIHPVHVSSGTEETQQCTTLASADACSGSQKGSRLSRSTSDGYEASGGEDSDRVPSRIVHRSSNWSSLLFDSVNGSTPLNILRTSSSAGLDVNNAQPF